jgi:hypothetical protein
MLLTHADNMLALLAGQLQETAVHSKESSLSTSRKHEAGHMHVQHHHLRLKTGELHRMLFPKAPAVVSSISNIRSRCINSKAPDTSAS